MLAEGNKYIRNSKRGFLSCVSIRMRDIGIANPSVCVRPSVRSLHSGIR